MLCISCHFRQLKPLTLRMDHAKLLDVLTSLPVSHAILPRAMCFATSRPANHAICSYIDSSGYASGPIRICLFLDYIIMVLITYAVQSLYNTPLYQTNLDITRSCCGSRYFLTMEYYKEIIGK